MIQLTAQQEQVLTLVANGRTVTAAAKEAEVDRSTVLAWRRGSADFRESFALAQYEQTLYWREQIESLGSLAIITLRQVMMDNSPSACFRAAAAVLDRLTKTPAPQPELPPQGGPSAKVSRPTESRPESRSQDNPQPSGAAPPQSQEPSDAAAQLAPKACTIRTIAHSPGRNSICPCGSGLKYKRCCLGTTESQPKLRAMTQTA
jgi:hypothetical protein